MYLNDQLLFWSDNKELSSKVDAIDWNPLEKDIYIYIYIIGWPRIFNCALKVTSILYFFLGPKYYFIMVVHNFLS